MQPQFAFGHGLSYTTFSYENMKVAAGDDKTTATITIKNTGKVGGAEVAQLYVKQVKSSLKRPEKELKAFQKIFLKPGESKEISFELNDEAFHYFNDKENKWVVEPGKFDILIGSSSRDIRQQKSIVYNN
ncbi:Thermostable beta-glucosidase B [compost metagenome]